MHPEHNSFSPEGNCSLTCSFSNKIHKSLLELTSLYIICKDCVFYQLLTLFSGHDKEERRELGKETEGRL